MNKQTTYQAEESFLLQEIILGVTIAIGMILMVANEGLGLLLVMLAAVSLAAIYLIRLYYLKKQRREASLCYYAWFNNGAMILAVAGILMLILLNAFHRPVFYSGLAILLLAMIGNAIFLRYDFRGMTHITAQIRLLIAVVVMLVFFLL